MVAVRVSGSQLGAYHVQLSLANALFFKRLEVVFNRLAARRRLARCEPRQPGGPRAVRRRVPFESSRHPSTPGAAPARPLLAQCSPPIAGAGLRRSERQAMWALARNPVCRSALRLFSSSSFRRRKSPGSAFSRSKKHAREKVEGTAGDGRDEGERESIVDVRVFPCVCVCVCVCSMCV